MKAWELIVLILGFTIIYLRIPDFLSYRDPFDLFASSVGIYLVLIVLGKKYYNYFNPELAFVLLIIFQASILAYICIFAPIYLSNISFYIYIAFFVYCLADLYVVYKGSSKC